MSQRLGGTLPVVSAVLLVAMGCLAEPPVFQEKSRVPPLVFHSQVTPPIGHIYQGGIPVELIVPFQSEDLNESLEARVYLNLPLDGSDTASGAQVPVAAGHWEDGVRTVSLTWQLPVVGCNTLTMVLAAQQSFPAVGVPPPEAQAARVVWWLSTEDDAGQVAVESCGPGRGEALR